MRWILTTAALAAVCTGCSSQGGHASAPPGCAARVTWNSTVYYAVRVATRAPATLLLGTGGRPTCGGVNGGEAGASSTVVVRRMIDVDPRVAVAVQGESGHAYLARAYFVRLTNHRASPALRKLVPRLIAPA